ncbi:MAG: nucleotidyltransferase domain-containing protein [Rhizonema sp. PD38]|nr:nucleotidyltransferase domain-containing protein [Rhizonema sp. PD38]
MVTAYFLDTSALLKRYVSETGTAWIQPLTIQSAGNLLVVALCYLTNRRGGVTGWGQETMKRNEVLAIVAAHKEQLQTMGVKSLNLFGSVARDEADPDSDVDFLVEFDRSVGLFEFNQVQLYLEDILGQAVDIGRPQALKQHVREPILKEAIRAI